MAAQSPAHDNIDQPAATAEPLTPIKNMPINAGTGSATIRLDSTGAVTGSFGPGSST